MGPVREKTKVEEIVHWEDWRPPRGETQRGRGTRDLQRSGARKGKRVIKKKGIRNREGSADQWIKGLDETVIEIKERGTGTDSPFQGESGFPDVFRSKC